MRPRMAAALLAMVLWAAALAGGDRRSAAAEPDGYFGSGNEPVEITAAQTARA